jgi:hypothetical protein
LPSVRYWPGPDSPDGSLAHFFLLCQVKAVRYWPGPDSPDGNLAHFFLLC